MLDDQAIAYGNTVRYLGVTFKDGLSIKPDYSHAKMAYYKSFNMLQSKSVFATSELVSCHLVKTICVPILSYGGEALNASKSVFRQLDSLVDSAVRRVFGSNDKMDIAFIRRVCELTSVEKCIKLRVCNFFYQVTFSTSRIWWHTYSCSLCKDFVDIYYYFKPLRYPVLARRLV
jgi:hypothetical protein